MSPEDTLTVRPPGVAEETAPQPVDEGGPPNLLPEANPSPSVSVTTDGRLQELLTKRQRSGLSDDEARELGELWPQIPGRPDEAGRSEDQWPKRGKRWERVWAIVGIVFGFGFLLTIPGWIGLDHYRKWQRYERTRPTGFIVWGIFMTALVPVIIGVAALIAVTRDSSIHLPDSIAGRTKMTSNTFVGLADGVAKDATVDSMKPEVAFYGTESQASFAVLLYDGAPPLSEFPTFFREFALAFADSSGGSVDLGSSVSESRDSGTYACALFTAPNVQGSVCVWDDTETLGIVVKYGEVTLRTAVDFTADVRQAALD
jgi:hypothetical protein